MGFRGWGKGGGHLSVHAEASTPREVALVIAKVLSAGPALKSCLSNGVLEATAGTTLKLFLVCGLIGYLLASGRLSEDTAPVLSKVPFLDMQLNIDTW